MNTWENHRFNPEVGFMPKIIAFLGYDPAPAPPTSFPVRLKAARIAAGHTRRQLAAQIGAHSATVAKWERGEAQPSEGFRERIRAFLKVLDA
jgi:DNA-binding XRE family transcriptional regulator